MWNFLGREHRKTSKTKSKHGNKTHESCLLWVQERLLGCGSKERLSLGETVSFSILDSSEKPPRITISVLGFNLIGITIICNYVWEFPYTKSFLLHFSYAPLSSKTEHVRVNDKNGFTLINQTRYNHIHQLEGQSCTKIRSTTFSSVVLFNNSWKAVLLRKRGSIWS